MFIKRTPKPNDCKKCGGTGWQIYPGIGKAYDCPWCNGTGKRKKGER